MSTGRMTGFVSMHGEWRGKSTAPTMGHKTNPTPRSNSRQQKVEGCSMRGVQVGRRQESDKF